jgi:hypothetical protein
MGLLKIACSQPRVSAMLITDKAELANVVDYVVQGNTAQMRDQAFMDELVSWIRFCEQSHCAGHRSR